MIEFLNITFYKIFVSEIEFNIYHTKIAVEKIHIRVFIKAVKIKINFRLNSLILKSLNIGQFSIIRACYVLMKNVPKNENWVVSPLCL